MDCPIYTSTAQFSLENEGQYLSEKESLSSLSLTPQCEKIHEIARENFNPLRINDLNHSESDEKKLTSASLQEINNQAFLIRKSIDKQIEYNRHLFYDAIKKGILDVVATLYSENNIKTIFEKKEVIELAIEHSQTEVFLFFIQNAQNDDYLELINHSIQFGLTNGHITFIDYLLNQETLFLTHNYIKTLRLAINARQLQVIHFFITDGRFDFSKHSLEIFSLAIQVEDVRIFERLLHDSVKHNLSQNNNYLLKLAITLNLRGFVELLLNDPRLNINNDYSEILDVAIKAGNLTIFEYLLNDFTFLPLSKKGIDLLTQAINDNQPDFVQLLLNDARVKISTKSHFLLFKACHEGYFEIVQIFSNNVRIDPSYKKNKAVRLAIIHGHMDIINYLLNHPRISLSKDANKIFRVAIKTQQELVVNALLQNEQLIPYMNHKQLQKLAKNKGTPQIYSLLVNFLE